MIYFWHRRVFYKVPDAWTCFRGADGWTLTRYERDHCWVARRAGFRKERINA